MDGGTRAKPTKDIGDRVRHPEKGQTSLTTAIPGLWDGWGIPGVEDEQVVGTVAVSGLSSSEDIVLATQGVEAVFGK